MDPSSSHATASLKQDDHVNISFRPFCLDLMLINQQIMGRNPPEKLKFYCYWAPYTIPV